jgi:beta-fructofuranosidase
MKKMIYSVFAIMLSATVLTACSEDDYSADPAKDWAGTANFFLSADDEGFNTYYMPAVGRCGDPMPFYDQKAGEFKVLYLQEYDNNGPCYHPFWGVSTKDGANYQSLGEVLPTGLSTKEADASLGTGCAVYNEQDGLYYIYYTGHNVLLQDVEVVMRATSPDFKTWTKDNTWVLRGQEYGYSATDFRDPQVFRADDGLWHMIIASNLRFAEFKSSDMKTWEHVGQFPMIWDRMCECPDIFQMGDYWYMVYSEGYRADWSRKVKYMMATTYEGLKACFNDPGANWPKDGHEGVLDSRAFYAGKTATNGTDRYIWGWSPYRSGATIHEKNINVGAEGEPNWSGALVCHKIIQHADGTLTLGEVPAMKAKYNNDQTVAVMASNGYNNGTLTGDDAYVLYNRLGSHNHISLTVTTSNNWDKFGISLVRSTDADFYYTMVVNPEDENHRKVNFEQEGYRIVRELDENGKEVEKKVYGKGFVAGIDGYWFQRPTDNVYHIDIYTDNSVLVMYINDVCAYTQRIYGIQKNCWSINNYGGSITISDVKVSQY